MPISNTQDIFYIVLSFCILWFTIFVCWLLYYFIAITREARNTIRDVRDKVKKVEEVIHGVKEKFEKSFALMGVAAEGLKYAIGAIKSHQQKKAKKKKEEE